MTPPPHRRTRHPARTEPTGRPARSQPGRAVGLALVVAAFAAALAWRWWPPAVLAGYVLLTASTVLLARRGLR